MEALADLDDVGFPLEFREIDRRLTARTQIIQASRSLILNDDAISAMTLVCAALDVLAGVSRARNLKTWLEQGTIDFGDGVGLARQAVRSQYNFLKHSNKDPDRQLKKLQPDLIMVLIYGAVHDYEQLYNCLSVEMMLVRMWSLARLGALRDEQEHQELYAKLNDIFDEPALKPFNESRATAAAVLSWCDREPLEVAERLFGPPPQPRRCMYSGSGAKASPAE